MSCTTCQDCSCDSITLPVAIGPTGATGPQGPAGADGTSSSVVLFSDVVSETTSQLIETDLVGHTYTLPIGQVDSDGSKVKLKALFKLTGSTVGYVHLYINGSRVNAYSMPSGGFPLLLSIEVDMIRKTSTSFFIDFKGTYTLKTTLLTTPYIQDIKSSFTVNNLDTLTNIIKFAGNVDDAGDVLTCLYSSIEFIAKI